MERQSHGTNRVSKIRRIPYRITKRLGESHKIDESSTRYYEEIIWQEKKESSRTEGQRKCVVGSQEHSFEQTFKEVGPEKIQTFYDLKEH